MHIGIRIAIVALTIVPVLSCASRPRDPLTTAEVLDRSERAIGGSTLQSIREAMEIVENNIRNADATGFKRSTARTGVDGKLQVALCMEQGSLENTGRSLDLGISGVGFFRVKVPDDEGGGVAYTRNGNFFVNNKGELVLGLGSGHQLDPPLSIPPNSTEISISQAGLVQVIPAGQVERISVGQVVVWEFVAPEQLESRGGSMYRETDASGPPIKCRPGENGTSVLLQCFLEKSNVSLEVEKRRMRFLQEWLDVVGGR